MTLEQVKIYFDPELRSNTLLNPEVKRSIDAMKKEYITKEEEIRKKEEGRRIYNYIVAASTVLFSISAFIAANSFMQYLVLIIMTLTSSLTHLAQTEHRLAGLPSFSRYENLLIIINSLTFILTSLFVFSIIYTYCSAQYLLESIVFNNYDNEYICYAKLWLLHERWITIGVVCLTLSEFVKLFDDRPSSLYRNNENLYQLLQEKKDARKDRCNLKDRLNLFLVPSLVKNKIFGNRRLCDSDIVKIYRINKWWFVITHSLWHLYAFRILGFCFVIQS